MLTFVLMTGYGKFHYLLLAVSGFANASDAIEILCVSILLPAAQCDLNMNSVEKGWLNAMLMIGQSKNIFCFIFYYEKIIFIFV